MNMVSAMKRLYLISVICCIIVAVAVTIITRVFASNGALRKAAEADISTDQNKYLSVEEEYIISVDNHIINQY